MKFYNYIYHHFTTEAYIYLQIIKTNTETLLYVYVDLIFFIYLSGKKTTLLLVTGKISIDLYKVNGTRQEIAEL